MLSTFRKIIASKITRRIFFIVFALPFVYLLIAVFGLIPVNSGFKETESGVEIFVYSDAAHSEFVFPTINKTKDWTEQFGTEFFTSGDLKYPYVGFGWGDRKFFIETPTWSDIKLNTTASAFFLPTEAAMKVTYQSRPVPGESLRRVSVSHEQYKVLVHYVESGLADGRPLVVGKYSHGNNDRFFEATGKYHLFANCNAWVGRGLQNAGVKVGWYTPLPKTVFWYLEKPESN